MRRPLIIILAVMLPISVVPIRAMSASESGPNPACRIVGAHLRADETTGFSSTRPESVVFDVWGRKHKSLMQLIVPISQPDVVESVIVLPKTGKDIMRSANGVSCSLVPALGNSAGNRQYADALPIDNGIELDIRQIEIYNGTAYIDLLAHQVMLGAILREPFVGQIVTAKVNGAKSGSAMLRGDDPMHFSMKMRVPLGGSLISFGAGGTSGVKVACINRG